MRSVALHVYAKQRSVTAGLDCRISTVSATRLWLLGPAFRLVCAIQSMHFG